MLQTIKWKNLDKKNEFIIKSVKDAIKEEKTVLILEPRLQNVFYMNEILKKNFDVPIDIYHSKLKKTETRNIWLRTAKGETKIIIATR
ncbi:MAG: hypothetical protein HQ536_01050, partial [Parcubacteria group bacterium]|nr:hypothetical protein [Parcubacteria group bacterium]